MLGNGTYLPADFSQTLRSLFHTELIVHANRNTSPLYQAYSYQSEFCNTLDDESYASNEALLNPA